MQPVIRRIQSIIFPYGIIMLSAVILDIYTPFSFRIHDAFPMYSTGVFIIAAVISLWFHHFRLMYGALFFFLLSETLCIDGQLSGLFLSPALRFVVWWALIPLNMILLAIFPQRGVMNRRSIMHLMSLLAQFGALYFLESIHLSVDAAGDLLASLMKILPSGAAVFGFVFLIGATLLMVALRKSHTWNMGVFWSFFPVAMLLLFQRRFSALPHTEFLLSSATGILILAALNSSFRMAYFDELTGLPGRRALNEKLRELGGSFSIAMADIDHFKRINDRFGHDTGDQVLKMVAGRLQRVAGGGKAYRYGGEEFSIIFPGKSLKQALDACEAVRHSVAEKPFILRGKRRLLKRGGKTPPRKGKKRKSARMTRKIPVTVSIGIAERNGKLTTSEAVLQAADKALYRAKKGGRNKVCA